MADWKLQSLPFSGHGQWVRTALHCHTRESDGGLSPADTVSRYADLGYHCIAITDHRKVTSIGHLSTESMSTFDGIEVGGQPDLIGIAVDRAPDPSLPFCTKVKMLAEQGAFTIGAHPSYSAAMPETYLECPAIDAIEIYNAYCDEAYANGLSTELWDMLLRSGMRVWGVASDDAHLNPEKRYFSDAGHAWIEVWADEIKHPSILDALRKGSFYSTQGPRFISFNSGESSFEFSCTPVDQVRWRSWGPSGFVQYSGGEPITRSRLPDGFSPKDYLRVELVDSEGRRAWSNPFFLLS
jgi:hypothetical protein